MPDTVLVSIIMGSDSDWPLVKKTYETLKHFGVPTEARVMSAHRTPDTVREHVKNSEANGVKVFIGAAGKAAHLPGVIAAYTVRPVIGLPVGSQALAGLDALLSIVQMPSGIPVATVAVDGAENAALLAVQILAASSEELDVQLKAHRRQMSDTIAKKDASITGPAIG